MIEELLISLFSRGHCLLEGVPGLAKTLMISTLSRALNLTFSRIQFTPDLMPADITGTDVIEENRSTGARDFRFLEGPLFSNVILADEINRTPPKTQAALLEAMQERQVTVGRVRHKLADPFFVLATQNPIEQEGTYPLPEAQQDRFMFKVFVRYPSFDEEFEVVRRTTSTLVDSVEPVLTAAEILELQRIVRQVPVSDHVIRYALSLVRQTRVREPGVPDFVQEQLSWGAGPRAVQFLILGAKARALLQGRTHVTCEDVQALAKPVLAAPPGAEFHRRERRRHARRPDRADCGDHPHPRRRTDAAMHDSKRFLHPEAIKRIARLDLRARHVVEGFLSGMHRSPYFGQSIEFRQHRQYTYGDDLRYVDWKVWAKQDRYYVKQFEEDTNLRCTLLCDVSGSMRYGRGRDEQVRVRLHDRRQPGLSAAAAAGRGRLRGLRRRRPDDRPPAHQAEPPGFDHPGPGAQQPAKQDRPLPDPPQRGRELSAAGTDGVGVGPAGGSRGPVPRPAAAAEPRARRDGVPRAGRRRVGFPLQRADAVRGPGTARATPLQPAGAARRISCRRWAPIWRKSAAAVPGTTSITPCSAPASRWTPRWPRI